MAGRKRMLGGTDFAYLRAEISSLEKDKEALLKSYATLAPVALDSLTPEERQQVYNMLRLTVTADPDGTLEADGVLASDVSKNEITGPDNRRAKPL